MEHILQAVGLDLGNSLCKAVAGGTPGPKDARNWVEVPTVVVRDVVDWERSEESRRELPETLYVRISSGAVSGVHLWAVGETVTRRADLAPNGRTPARDSVKVETEELFVAGLSALALLAIYQARLNSKTKEAGVRIKMITASLPYKQHTKANKAKLRDLLRGTHVLEFVALERIGALKLTLTIEKVKSTPEGLPAILAQTYKVKDGVPAVTRQDLLGSVLVVVDVGGGTVDCLLFDEDLNLDDSRSTTLNLGINDALRKAHAELVEAGWGDTLTTLSAMVKRLKEGEEELSGKGGRTVNIRQTLNKHLQPTAFTLGREIQSRWTNSVKRVFLVGGGGHLLPQLLDLPADTRPEVPANGEWQNALGNYIVSLLELEG